MLWLRGQRRGLMLMLSHGLYFRVKRLRGDKKGVHEHAG